LTHPQAPDTLSIGMDVKSNSSATQAAIAAQARARAEAEKQTRQVERDAQERIQNAQTRAQQVEQEMDLRMDHVRDATETAVELSESKREATLGSLKNQTYKDVADLKRRTAAELARIRSEGDRQVENAQDHYRDQTQLAEYEGQKQLRESVSKNARLQTYQERAAQNEREILKRAHAEEVAAQEKQFGEQRAELQSQGESEIKRIQEKTAAGRRGAEQHFEATFSGTVKANAEALNRANQEAKRQLDQLRSDHALRLERYEGRLEDPFYRMVDLGVEIRDHGEYYTLEAKIPEHERDHFKVNVRGKEVIVSGARRNEEALELGEGKSRKVSSFQTYQEVVPLEWPVDTKNMLREFDGSRVIVTLPKQGSLVDPRTGEERPLDRDLYSRSSAMRPDFPAGVPGIAPQRPDKPIGQS